MAGLVTRLPFPLTGRAAGAGSATYALKGVKYDFALGGMPFLAAITDDRPMTRGLAPIRKEQFDNQQIPGEQSLANWWLRSQSTFIGGCGLLYQDPSSDNQYAVRFAESAGVNPWVNGQLTLLRSTSERIDDASANVHRLVGWSDGTDRYWSAVGSTLKSDDGTTVTTITWGGAGTIRSLTSDGTHYFAADNVGIYSGTGSGAGAKLWDTGSANVVVGWVKGRLMAAVDNKLYELVGGTPPTLPTPVFTHLNTGFTFTAIAEGTNAIYVAGNAGAQGDIYKLTLDSTGAVPTLASGGTLAAQLPLGEVVLAMTSYLGTFVGLGTNRGFRVGQIDDQGDIVYGPLLIENSAGCKAVGAYDRFFFVGASNGIDGSSGLYRVDLGQPIQNNDVSPSIRFAYATDLQAHVTGEVTAVSNFGTSDRMVFAVAGQGAYLEHATQREASGYLTTGRVRFNTLEPKVFKFMSVKAPNSILGSVGAAVIDPGGAETSLITASEGSSMVIEDVILAAPQRAVEWIALKFTLTRSGSDATQGGEINGWQLKAMPGVMRQRVFTVPLLCFDKERDISGQLVGRKGRTLARLQAFEELAQRGDAASWQDLRSGASYLVVVDNYEFRQTANPGSNNTNYGGILWVNLRTIADVVST